MSALTAQRYTGLWLPMKTLSAKVAADVKIFKGANCGFLGGYLYPWDAVVGLAHPCIAIPNRGTSVDNTGGADGALSCDVEFPEEKILYPFGNDVSTPIAQAHIGGIAYGLDDQTVTASPTGASPLGTPWIISDGTGTNLRAGVYVELPAGALAAFIADLKADTLLAPGMQAVNATLASGTITIATGIVVASNSEVVPLQIGTITGSTNFGSLRELKASRVNGIAGVGTVVIEAVGADGAKDVDAAGAIRVVILTPQS